MSWSSFIGDAPKEHHSTTQKGVELLAPRHDLKALDIGAGNGRDSRYLAKLGFEVTAIDISEASAGHLGEHEFIRFVCGDICHFSLERYHLINASLVLPFIPQDSFRELWPRLLEALEPGGVFCGHFFGIKDWKVQDNLAWGLERESVLELLEPLNVEVFGEHLSDGANQIGQTVTKHNYGVVARVAT